MTGFGSVPWTISIRRPAGPNVVCQAGSQKVIGYFALSMGQILAHEVIGSMRRNMPNAIPAVVLGRLAVDREWQGCGATIWMRKTVNQDEKT